MSKAQGKFDFSVHHPFKGKVVDKTFFINGEAIRTVSEKPVKSLGSLYDGDLKDTL